MCVYFAVKHYECISNRRCRTYRNVLDIYVDPNFANLQYSSHTVMFYASFTIYPARNAVCVAPLAGCMRTRRLKQQAHRSVG